ncbi:MAG: hypothetical protein GXO15_04665 [Crenarchaeota archaeon]|nr:hypothetical protein [Thermoproteota archaeon]
MSSGARGARLLLVFLSPEVDPEAACLLLSEASRLPLVCAALRPGRQLPADLEDAEDAIAILVKPARRAGGSRTAGFLLLP